MRIVALLLFSSFFSVSCAKGVRSSLRALRTKVKRLSADLERTKQRARSDRALLRGSILGLRKRIKRLQRSLAARPRAGSASNPTASARCSEAMLATVRGLRQGSQGSDVQTQLRGVPLARERSVRLTGAGTVPMLTLRGPCFRVVIVGGKLDGAWVRGHPVALPGAEPARRPRRRRRRRP